MNTKIALNAQCAVEFFNCERVVFLKTTCIICISVPNCGAKMDLEE